MPSCASITSLYSPDLSLKYEIHLPSGDHAGWRSADPLACVMLRTSPFSAGIVKISPRASTTTRLPVADRPRFVMRAVTSSKRGIIQGKSPAALIRERLLLAGLRIELVDEAALLEHHHAAAGVERLDVEVDEPGELRELLRGGFVRPDVGDAVAVRDEVHRIAQPHRVDVLRIRPWRRDQVEGLQVDDPDRPVLAAAVVAPFLVPRVVHAVRDPLPSGESFPW